MLYRKRIADWPTDFTTKNNRRGGAESEIFMEPESRVVAQNVDWLLPGTEGRRFFVVEPGEELGLIGQSERLWLELRPGQTYEF